MNLWHLTAREVGNRPGRAVLTILSIVIGVAAVVSVSMATSTTRSAFKNMFELVAGKASLIVTSVSGENFDEAILADINGRPAEKDSPALDKIAGVVAAVPSMQADAETWVPNSAAAGVPSKKEKEDKKALRLIGIDPKLDSQVRVYTLMAGAYFEPNQPGCVLDASSAASLGVNIGDSIHVQTRTSGKVVEWDAPIIGLVKPKEGGAVATSLGGVAFFSLESVRGPKFLKQPGKINFIHLITDSKTPIEKIEREIQRRLDARFLKQLREDLPASIDKTVHDILNHPSEKALADELTEKLTATIIKTVASDEFSRDSAVQITKDIQREIGAIDPQRLSKDDAEPINNELQDVVSAFMSERFKVDRAGTSTKQAEEAILPTEQGLHFATAASFVLATFIILNTFLMNVGERRRQLSILRAIGATRSQIIWLLLGEGLLMGTIGTILGIGLGFVGAYFLTRAMEGVMQSALPSIIITPWPFILGPAFGLGMSLLGTYVPARKAGRLSPLEGMGALSREDRQADTPFFASIRDLFVQIFQMIFSRGKRADGTTTPRDLPPIWPTAGLGFLLVGGSELFACLKGWLPVYFAITSAMLMLIGLVLLMPLALKPLCRVATIVMTPIMGITTPLAAGQLLRRRTRTALTVGVLFIALAMGMGMGSGIVDSIRDVKSWYRNTIVGDLFVRAGIPSGTGETKPIPDEDGMRKSLEAIPGIAKFDEARFTNINLLYRTADGQENKKQITLATRYFVLGDKANLNLVDGDPNKTLKNLEAGEIVMGTVVAERTGLKTGDDATLMTNGGPRPFHIASLSNEYTAGGTVIYMHQKTAQKYFSFNGVAAFAINCKPGESAAVAKEVEALAKDRHLIFQSLREITDMIDGYLTGAVGGQWLILVLGFVVAAFGVVNTLTMNVLEQTRELGLLRIVAMTRSQVRRLILSQAAMIGLLGLTPGILAGLVVSYLINLSMLPLLGHPVVMEWHPFMVFGSFFVGLLIVLLAAMFPAERAARIELSTALQYE